MPRPLDHESLSPNATPPFEMKGEPMLQRRLGLLAATSVVVGTIIGSGIFRVPGSVAAQVGTPWGVAAVWVLGGVITLCGALSLAELAAAFPRAGGVVVYLHELYGPGMAFVFGWTMLVTAPAASAAVALVFAEYLGTLVPLSPTGIRLVAAAAVTAIGIACYRSVRGSGAITSVATAAKVGALLALVFAAFALGGGEGGASAAGSAAATKTHWGGVGLALVAALWAYNGFQDMVCVAGEVRDPGRVLPRALMMGTAIVVLVYLSANAAYLYVLPFETLSSSPLVASDVAVRLIGTAGAAAVAGMVMVSTFGALTGVMLTQPRIFYAMAVDGLFFGQLARVHPRFGTPHVAVAAYTIATVACVWSRSFEQLAEAFVLGVWPFLALAVAGVFTLRRSKPELHRPYRTPGYPAVPAAFIAGTVWVIGSALWARPGSTLAGIGLTLLGVPIYLAWRALARRRRLYEPLPGPSAPPSA